VKGIPNDREALAVIRAVATLAQNLGIRMNAEGIEEEPQIPLLRMLGCTEGQGYFFGKPMPASELVKLIPIAMPVVGAAPATPHLKIAT